MATQDDMKHLHELAKKGVPFTDDNPFGLPPQPNIMDIAASAYRAYSWNRDWKDWRGNPMPQWDGLTPGIQIAWCCAAQQAIDVSQGQSYGLDTEKKWRGV